MRRPNVVLRYRNDRIERISRDRNDLQKRSSLECVIFRTRRIKVLGKQLKLSLNRACVRPIEPLVFAE